RRTERAPTGPRRTQTRGGDRSAAPVYGSTKARTCKTGPGGGAMIGAMSGEARRKKKSGERRRGVSRLASGGPRSETPSSAGASAGEDGLDERRQGEARKKNTRGERGRGVARLGRAGPRRDRPSRAGARREGKK